MNELKRLGAELKNSYVNGTKDDKGLSTTEAECIEMVNVLEAFHKNLKSREINQRDWKGFIPKDGNYIVSGAHNLFSTLSDLSVDKTQKSLYETSMGEQVNSNKQSMNNDSKIVPEYEEPDDEDDALSKSYYDQKSLKMQRMNCINSENIDKWIVHFKKAIDDYYKKVNTKIMLEDLFRSLKILKFIRDRLEISSLQEDDQENNDSNFVSGKTMLRREDACDYYV